MALGIYVLDYLPDQLKKILFEGYAQVTKPKSLLVLSSCGFNPTNVPPKKKAGMEANAELGLLEISAVFSRGRGSTMF